MTGNPVAWGPPGHNQAGKVTGGPYRPTEFQDTGRQGGPPPGGDGHGGPPPPGGHGRKSRGAPTGIRGGNAVGGSSAGMSIHNWEGLVPVNDKGASNIPGLFAVGDALGSYMAGAIYTQVGSSLAGSAVQGIMLPNFILYIKKEKLLAAALA